MAGARSISTIPKVLKSNQAQISSRDSNTTSSTWATLFKSSSSSDTVSDNLTNFLDLPPELIDIILGYACSNWAVTIEQLPPDSLNQRGPILISTHQESAERAVGLAALAKTNKVLYEHPQRFLHSSLSFSGYTQLIGLYVQSLVNPQGLTILLDVAIAAFWPDTTPEQFLKWGLRATTVLEMSLKIWEVQPIPVNVGKAFPNGKRVIFVGSLAAAFSKFTVRQNRVVMPEKVREVDRCEERWAKGIKRLIISGVRVTMRVSRVHPSCRNSHPMFLNNNSHRNSPDVSSRSKSHHTDSISEPTNGHQAGSPPLPSLPYHPSNCPIRVAPRDFHITCCTTGRSDDPTLKFMYADLRAVGLRFKPVDDKDGQPCDVCRHWRLIWAGVNGDRKRFSEKEDKESKLGGRGRFW